MQQCARYAEMNRHNQVCSGSPLLRCGGEFIKTHLYAAATIYRRELTWKTCAMAGEVGGIKINFVKKEEKAEWQWRNRSPFEVCVKCHPPYSSCQSLFGTLNNNNNSKAYLCEAACAVRPIRDTLSFHFSHFSPATPSPYPSVSSCVTLGTVHDDRENWIDPRTN